MTDNKLHKCFVKYIYMYCISQWNKCVRLTRSNFVLQNVKFQDKLQLWYILTELINSEVSKTKNYPNILTCKVFSRIYRPSCTRWWYPALCFWEGCPPRGLVSRFHCAASWAEGSALDHLWLRITEGQMNTWIQYGYTVRLKV